MSLRLFNDSWLRLSPSQLHAHVSHITINQMFSLVHDWSKSATRLNFSWLSLRNKQVIVHTVPDRSNLTGNTFYWKANRTRNGTLRERQRSTFRTRTYSIENAITRSIEKAGIEMFPDCLPVSSDSQNIFSPVSTNIQLEQYHFKNAKWLVLWALFASCEQTFSMRIDQQPEMNLFLLVLLNSFR